MLQALYLVLLIVGILTMLAGLYLTRQTWRDDIPPYRTLGPTLPMTLQIAVHPERFAKPDRLPQIRRLNLAAALLLCGAVGVVIYDIVRAMSRG